MMDQLASSIEHIRNGRLKAFAVSSKKRSPLLPDVPTLDESGVPGYEASTFAGIFAPVSLSATGDRKSTRLNSSHTVISYAVFCLKKKNQDNQRSFALAVS